jgi:prepilin-type N-terminal cleavage/methylation domain-containing protein
MAVWEPMAGPRIAVPGGLECGGEYRAGRGSVKMGLRKTVWRIPVQEFRTSKDLRQREILLTYECSFNRWRANWFICGGVRARPGVSICRRKKLMIMKYKAYPKTGFTLIEIMIVVAIIGLLATIAIPNFMHARVTAEKTACINNLRQIDNAKENWAMESKATPNATPTISNIQPYMGRGTAGTAPTCPMDSNNTFLTSYSINDLQTAPTCLILPGVPGDTTGHHLN